MQFATGRALEFELQCVVFSGTDTWAQSQFAERKITGHDVKTAFRGGIFFDTVAYSLE